MESVGSVTSILNERLFIFESSSSFSSGDKVLVFSETQLTKKQAKKAGIEKIIFPKGTFSVLAQQATNKYLATFSIKKVKKTVIDNSSLAAKITGLSGVFGELKTVVEEEQLDNNKNLDISESLGVKIIESVKVGDQIARA